MKARIGWTLTVAATLVTPLAAQSINIDFGPQNTAESIAWMNDDEATLWVTDKAGATISMAHLTNLADWRLDGTIKTDEELRRDWLLIGDT